MPEVRFLDITSSGRTVDLSDVRAAAGTDLTIRAYAQVSEPDSDIKEVQLVWIEPDGLVRFFPMLRQSEDIWKIQVKLPAGTVAGDRQCCLKATTYRGESRITEHLHMH
jgi:hypothetical protein